MNSREVVIGVAGGIAAYKAAALVSQLIQANVHVTVVMTESARHFIAPSTFAALTGRPVALEIFEDEQYPLGAHITLAQRADLLCIAPATANILAKAAHGLADDLLSTLYLCARKPVLVAPAMNCEMWDQPSVQRNVAQLRSDGVQIIDPEEGWLSCRQRGVGRMAAPETIFAAISAQLENERRVE